MRSIYKGSHHSAMNGVSPKEEIFYFPDLYNPATTKNMILSKIEGKKMRKINLPRRQRG
ncbi:hypothetical protein [Porphyromonas circumdentaria]|uniref:Uncharacterized protein n=1 Tax=Porphyromonas circumdentaria TaxID=29524 RepID=A0A1T4L293_9PORP|nr:hypothetical protein [Porphyromonas circumdentaria]MBB6275194.1 hypothetical protein [Porphyromonas circumdentaria]MDO4721824.1 hypothetical protein [Porphyromonas circumdentaria]SJZ48773.1 hypothetical protein SAMN02745171_00276 [Porphyromonas circumdentaria]